MYPFTKLAGVKPVICWLSLAVKGNYMLFLKIRQANGLRLTTQKLTLHKNDIICTKII